jgi:hypothetical protein
MEISTLPTASATSPCSGSTNPNAPMIWWEYRSADHCEEAHGGNGFSSAASGGAGDFDGDGWIDLVAGNSWFKNPGRA